MKGRNYKSHWNEKENAIGKDLCELLQEFFTCRKPSTLSIRGNRFNIPILFGRCCEFILSRQQTGHPSLAKSNYQLGEDHEFNENWYRLFIYFRNKTEKVASK